MDPYLNQVEITRLQNEMKQLRQQVEALEKEVATLKENRETDAQLADEHEDRITDLESLPAAACRLAARKVGGVGRATLISLAEMLETEPKREK